MTDAEAHRYKPYPSYKATGASWLSEIPVHWEARPIRTVARVINGATPSTSVPDYWDGDIVWITPDDLGKSQERLITSSERRITQEGYEACGTNLAPLGSIVLSTRAPVGHIGILGSPACTNQGCRLLSVKENFQSTFAFYQLTAARPELESLGQGTTFTELSKGTLAAFPVTLPPVDEQSAIVRYLDDADQRIRAYVSAKERLIGLLEEERQTVIHQAVTRGLNLSVRLKPSGVEWMEDVPEHWEDARFGQNITIAEGQVDPRIEPYSSMLMIAPNHVESGTGRLLKRETAKEQGAISGKYFCRAGDVVYSKIRPGLAKVTVAPSNCLCSADMYPLRPGNSLQSDFLLWLLLSTGFTAWSVLESGRVAMPKINRQTLNNIHIPLPPLAEQASIVQHLVEATVKASNAISHARRQIDLMNEYRTRLIADVVTGQLDVREATAHPK